MGKNSDFEDLDDDINFDDINFDDINFEDINFDDIKFPDFDLEDEDKEKNVKENKSDIKEHDLEIKEDDSIDLDSEFDELDDYEIDNTENEIYLEFNKNYKEYKDLKEDEVNNIERLNQLEEIMAVSIADDFNFSDKEIKNKKKAYVNFAIDLLRNCANKPYCRPLSALYYAKALFGLTNLAFNLSTKENQKKYINEGSKFVKQIETGNVDHCLKAYALTTRAFAYIMMGESLELKPGVKMKTIHNDLVYSVAWDNDNYLAHYALGLMYLNEYSKDYNVKQAHDEFSRTMVLADKKVPLDNYVSKQEKERIVSLAKKRLEALKDLD